jgi:di/tricarboxylate transporter
MNTNKEMAAVIGVIVSPLVIFILIFTIVTHFTATGDGKEKSRKRQKSKRLGEKIVLYIVIGVIAVIVAGTLISLAIDATKKRFL